MKRFFEITLSFSVGQYFLLIAANRRAIFLIRNYDRHHQLQSATLQQYCAHQVQIRHMMILNINIILIEGKTARKLCWQWGSGFR